MTTEYSIQKMVSDGTLSTIALGIQYLQRNDIYMRIAGEETPQSGAPSGYTWSFLDNTTLKILPVVPNGVEVVVYRRTDVDAMYNVYSQNAQFDEATIDENNQQLLYIAQEYLEQGIPGAGVDTIEFLRDDDYFTYYRMRRTDGSYSEEFTVPSAGNNELLMNALNSVGGAGLVGAANYAQIRAYTGTSTKINCYGISNIFDGGDGVFVRDDNDITSADNGGTLLVDLLGRRWRRIYDGNVWVDWFRAAGDADDTDAFKRAAAHIDLTWEPLNLKSKVYNISDTISFQTPPCIVGAAYSPPVVGKFQGVPYPVKGTVIMCNTGPKPAIAINDTSWYRRGLRITDVHVLGAPGKTSQYGVLLKNCGWGGYTRGLVIERFSDIGLQISQLQDTLFDQLEVLDCGKDNISPAVFISDYSNLLVFNRPRFELNEYQLLISGGFGFEFHGAHFEQGDYPGEGPDVEELLRINRYPSIRLQSTGVVKFIGGIITGATAARQMTKFGITADQIPYHLTVDPNCGDVSFIGTTIGAPYNNGKAIEFSGKGRFSGCTVQNMMSDHPSAAFNNQDLNVTGNQFLLVDGGYSTSFYGISASGAIINDNDFICENSASAEKSSGAIIEGVARIGENRFKINKYALASNNSVSASTSSTGSTTTNMTGSIDLRKFNHTHVMFNNTAGTLGPLNGMVFGSETLIVNSSSGNLIIPHGGNISISDGANAVVPPGGMIKMFANPSSGVWTELYRRS